MLTPLNLLNVLNLSNKHFMDSIEKRSIRRTDFNFPGQGGVYHGKVRDGIG